MPSIEIREEFDGFPEPNYTKTPNLIFDKLLPVLSGSELKTILFIVRKTFGFQKSREFQKISIADIQKATGLSNRSAIDATESLVEMGMILRQKRRDSGGHAAVTAYRIRFRGEPSEDETLDEESSPWKTGVLSEVFAEKVHLGGGAYNKVLKETERKNTHTPCLPTPSTTLDTGELDPETGEEFHRQQPYKKNWKRPKAEKPHAKSDRLRELREAGSAGASVTAPTAHPRSDTPLPQPPMEPAAPQRDCIAIWNESFPALAVNPALYQNGNFPYALRDGSMLANMPDVVVKVRWLVDNGSDVTFSHLIRKEASGVFGWSAILSGSLDWTTKKRQNPKEKLNDFLESEMKELEKRRAAKHS